jgi:hypothetical protein
MTRGTGQAGLPGVLFRGTTDCRQYKQHKQEDARQ